MKLVAIATLAATAMLIGASTAEASTPDERCQHSRYKAAAKYIVCHQKGMADFFAGGPTPPGINLEEVSECRVKYAASWEKLRACDNTDDARFKDNDDGTVTDRMTMLQWERKTDDATVHDVDNVYSWSAGGGDKAADGTAFTSFLATLNGGGCFAGHCDWRLPTIAELQTILPETYPCTTSPCIDQTAFGPTGADYYWSDTPLATDPDDTWSVSFGPGSVGCNDKDFTYHVRAVRGGL